jgi:hypothetical protein
VGSVTSEALTDLLGRLERARVPPAWSRAVRIGVGRSGECEVQVDPDRWLVVRHAAGRKEGPSDRLVCLVERRTPMLGGTRVELERMFRATATESADDENPRRSVRIGGELWSVLESLGDPSTVLRELAEEALAARKRARATRARVGPKP